MSQPLVVIRPQPGNDRTFGLASAAGLPAIAMPLQDFEPLDWQLPPGDFDGLLIGSSMVFRFAEPALRKLLHLPVHAVGEFTSDMAQAAGFTVATRGAGSLQSLLDSLPADRPRHLLRIGGEERIALDPPPHVAITECAAYRMVDRDMTEGQAGVLRSPCCVLVHSVSAMQNFRRNCRVLSIEPAVISLACLGPRIADEAGDGWAACRSAATPDETALLALAKAMCQ